MRRDLGLGFLWLGAFITGPSCGSMDRNAYVFYTRAPWDRKFSHADECRLMYLSHDQYYNAPPLFPFAPFGSTAIIDTNINVRQYAQYETSHGLEYEGLTWHCHGGQRTATTPPIIPLRVKDGQPIDGNISVTYDSLDNEDDDCSEMVTMNIFTWLRDEDGFPVAERATREHEWINNLDLDDDYPVTGDAQSTMERICMDGC